MKYNPFYIISRFLRKILPDFIAKKFLSRTNISIEQLYNGKTNSTYMYLNIMKQIGLEKIFTDLGNFTILEAGTGIYNPASAPFILGNADKLILLEPYGNKKIDIKRFNERFYGLLKLAENDKTFPIKKK